MTRQNWGMASKMASIDLFNSSTSSLCFFFVSMLIYECNGDTKENGLTNRISGFRSCIFPTP